VIEGYGGNVGSVISWGESPAEVKVVDTVVRDHGRTGG
jgi:hypothetical protein